MAKITLLLDEDVRPMLGEILRQRGYDAVHVQRGVRRMGRVCSARRDGWQKGKNRK